MKKLVVGVGLIHPAHEKKFSFHIIVEKENEKGSIFDQFGSVWKITDFVCDENIKFKAEKDGIFYEFFSSTEYGRVKAGVYTGVEQGSFIFILNDTDNTLFC